MAKDCGQQWWKEAKYGMFIHWGLYARLAGTWNNRDVEGIGEWIMKRLDIPIPEYEKIAKDFNPVNFSAAEWVKTAKNAGMRYIVYTAKHHDGFAMYHSDCSKYNITDATPFARDPAAELAEQCKKEGIRLCFYYSQAQDWHDPDGYGYGPVPDEQKNFRRYLDEKCKPQIRELLTKYGDIGLIWFDTPQIMSAEYSIELRDLVKSIQPDCIVSGRIGNRIGEYMSTGDNNIPAVPYDGDWEVPATINDTWGFKAKDHNWKNPKAILSLLLKINSRGGNYLLNVGPDSKGVIPQPSIDVLNRVADFLKKNGDAVYGTKAVRNYPYETENVYLTAKDHHLYLNIAGKVKNFSIVMVNSKVKKATFLATGRNLEYSHVYSKASNQYRLHVVLPDELPCEFFNTVDLELEEPDPVFGKLDNL